VPQSVADAKTIDGNMVKPQAGACIFLDVRDHPDAGTDARIALPEEWVDYLRERVVHRFAAIAIVSEDTVERYKGCLPRSDTIANSENPVTVPLPVRKSAAMRAN
jgi:hypothetical protein